MEAVLRVVPVVGETTWSFLHRVAAAYGLEAADLAGGWRSASQIHRKDRGRADGEVLLDTVAQEQLAHWCRVPAGHLARALPSWAAGPPALAGRDRDGRGWVRWRTGVLEWGPVVFGCGLCAARRGDGGGRVWVYGPQWRRVCVRHGRWLLEPGGGHPLRWVEVASVAGELGRAQRRWARVARAAREGGAAPREVFALARAVVCWWWEREELWAREAVWGPRLERVRAATVRRAGEVAGWGLEQWRLLVRDAVIFPEVVAAARALVDPRLQERAGGGAGLLRDGAGGGPFAAALGVPLGRPWLAEVEEAGPGGPLTLWVSAMVRRRRGAPLRGRGVWWVHGPHRPVEAGAGLRLLVGASDTGTGRAAGVQAAELAVRAGHGAGLARWRTQLFEEGLEHARRHVERFGHLAVPHTTAGVREGFDLGRWLAYRRAGAALLSAEQAARLVQLDAWWNPPWPVDWQRAWYRARDFVHEHGPVHCGDNLDGLPRWLGLWLRQQISNYRQLHEGQQRLLAELGLGESEIKRFYAWPGRRHPLGEALAVAGAFAARHAHLAVSRPTTVDGFALGSWLAAARLRQRQAGRPTRLGVRLADLDAWWNPPWPIAWQRMWWAARHHLSGLPDGVQWWPDAPTADHAAAWLGQQAARRHLLQPAQQNLVDELIVLAGQVPQWRPRISDDAWQILSALLPPLPHHGGRRRSQRQLLEAIVHIACTGQPWTQLPQALGPFQTCLRRHQQWLSDGTLARIAGVRLPGPDTAWQQRLAAHITLTADRR
ncbi:Helicase associated domain protein [Streptomyces sp. NPDC005483]|uniref:Helicase associated domain protein n=1 Tax=Streptomyces sp. NPDC005483 TaxID=3154882 RepID=UPI0033A0AF18